MHTIVPLTTSGGINLSGTNEFGFLVDIISAAGVYINNGDNDLDLLQNLGDITTNGDLTIDCGTGEWDSWGRPIDAGSGTITFIADTINIANESSDTITTTGDIIIKPTTTSRMVGIGDSATGDFNLKVSEIGTLTPGYSSLTIGASGNTGAVDINDITFEGATTIYGGATSIETITTAGYNITMDTGNQDITDADSDTTDNFALSGGDLTINTCGWFGTAGAGYMDVNTTGTISVITSGSLKGVYINSKAASTDLGTMTLGGALSAMYIASAGPITQSGILNAYTFTLTCSDSVDLSTQDNNITLLNSAVVAGDLLINNGDNSFTLIGTVKTTKDGGGNITIDVGTDTLSTNDQSILCRNCAC